MTVHRYFYVLAAGLMFNVAAAPPAGSQPPPTQTAVMAPDLDAATAASGRELSKQFLAGDTDTIWPRLSSKMQAALQDAANFARTRTQILAQLGEETQLEREETPLINGMRVYRRIAHWSRYGGLIVMQWTLAADGRVLGFFVQPLPDQVKAPAPTPYLDRDTQADLRLPFTDDWFVFWGGRTLEQNYHAVDAGQRFAYDFVKRVNGFSHRGEGRALSDYYCWDAPITAPAAGRVVEAVNDQPDQAIGSTNSIAPTGNHVMLDLGSDEYLLLAHLRQDSVAVKAGDRVKRGDTLGRCGNSGNTSEPHLHLHVQDTPVFGSGKGLPAFFNDYLADGKPVAHGEPLRGQTIHAR